MYFAGDFLEMYATVNAEVGVARRAAVWASDASGWDGGRTRAMADRLAEETDLLVLVPNFFRGAYDPDEPQAVNWHDFMQVLNFSSQTLTYLLYRSLAQLLPLFFFRKCQR